MLKDRVAKKFPALKISTDVPYREITTLGVGSVLPVLAEPESAAQLGELLAYLTGGDIPFFILGGGSNLVGMDAPYPGIGIRLAGDEFSACRHEGNVLYCGAAAKLPLLTRYAAAAGLCGLAPLAGIPGTAGGALRMNAGCHGVEIGTFVRKVRGVDYAGRPWQAEGRDILWEYRKSSIPENVVVTAVEFELENGDAAAEEERIKEFLAARREREPAGRSAGCAFRNVSALEPAGKLIDSCGLRGIAIGDIKVSEKHANYIINNGGGSEADFVTVCRIVRRAVAEKYGYYLRFEVKTVDPDTAKQIENDPLPPVVNVLYGGNSSEREVSIRSGQAVASALRNAGLRVVETDIKECRVEPEMRDCDVVYPVLHGGFGEGGDLQELLEKEEIRFVGSGSVASRLVMDKLETKKLLDYIGIPTARWCRVTKADVVPPEKLRFPVILKAPCEGSTVGIIKVDTPDDWAAALEAELKHAPELLAEEFIEGVEVTVPVINGVATEAIEIRPPDGFYDYDAKYVYKNGHTEYFCPPVSLSDESREEIKRLAVLFYRAAGCKDILRVDFIIGKDDKVPYMLEGNSLPGCTSTSLVPKSARQEGISFERMTATLAFAALKRTAVPAVQKTGKMTTAGGVNPVLLTLTRILYYIVLVLASASLVLIGITLHRHGWQAWPLFAAAFLLLSGEPVYRLLCNSK